MLDGARAGGFVAGPAGPAAWGPVAAWASATAYAATAPASVVTYGGACYACTATHTSGQTFDATKWVMIAAPGAAGPQGATGATGAAGTNGSNGTNGTNGTNGATGPQPWQTPPAPWAANTAYTATAPASVVTYNGACYVCSTTHTSGASFDGSKFTLIAAAGVANTASGAPIQRVPAQTAVVGTTTVQTSISDTAPTTSNTSLITGLAVAITPKAAGNRIRVRVVAQLSLSVVGAMALALFQGASAPAQGDGASAVASNYASCPGNGYSGEVILTFDLVAASTAKIYFAVGIGSNNSGTLTINGIGGGRNFGGTTFSHVEVEEYAA